MKKIIVLFICLIASYSYAELNCNAIYKLNTLGGGIKSYKIDKVQKIDNNHYNLKLNITGTIRQKLDNVPRNDTHTLIDIKCTDLQQEQHIKELLQLN